MGAAVASGLYNQTFGRLWYAPEPTPEPEPDSYVCLDYLDRQAEQILRWANKAEISVISEAEFKRHLRKSTHHSEDDILLLISHLKHSGKMAVESIAPNETEEESELIMCKFAQIDTKKDLTISIKEKGKFALTVTLGKLDARIQSLQESITNAA